MDGRRIIPARAGFTDRQRRRTGAQGDHPRSRGVYLIERVGDLRGDGSSPLARGLLPLVVFEACAARIIPARAGFTRQWRHRQERCWDHPRSRGVYWDAHAADDESKGSSPLARGLREALIDGASYAGIIPARAGFTTERRSTSVSATDHPRSRGVYNASFSADQGDMGSSPLARGLHGYELSYVQQAGIIPARAGFTHGQELCPRCRQGSSPLARGLLGPPSLVADEAGIIPARAGFTLSLPVLGLPGWDHPRSRGVYVRTLADGRISVGIIPARAGFTLGDRRDSNGGPPYQGAFAFTGDLGTARLSCGSVVAGQRSTTTPSPV